MDATMDDVQAFSSSFFMYGHRIELINSLTRKGSFTELKNIAPALLPAGKPVKSHLQIFGVSEDELVGYLLPPMECLLVGKQGRRNWGCFIFLP